MIPPGPHSDWPWPFKYIPRRWTAWNNETPPHKLYGTAPSVSHLDITSPGTWAVTWWPYWTVRFFNGYHIRSGFRYDYNGHYYTFVILTIKWIA